MRDMLYDYQKKIFDSQVDKPSNALFLDMGTGKTPISMSLMNEKPVDKILVVCLVSKVDEWVSDYDRWLDTDLVKLRSGTKKNKELLKQDAKGYVVNFESLWRLGDDLLDMVDESWGIIVDESHMMKNPDSRLTKYMMKLGKLTPYKIILTGTPQSQGYIDYWTQMTFADMWDISISAFKKKYCHIYLMPRGKFKIPIISGYKNTNELDTSIQVNAVFFRRDKSEDMIPQDIDVSVGKNKRYDTFYKDKVLMIKDDIYLGDTLGAYRMGLKQLASGFIKKHRETTNHKLQWVDDFLKTYDDRVVIFYNFNEERDMIIELLEKHKRPISEYSGRKKDLDNFKYKDNAVVLVNYASGSTGINDLVLSEVAIFFSPVEDVITYQQSRGRLDRLGQERRPLFYYLVAKGTIDEAIYKSINTGKDFDDKMFEEYLKKC